MPRPFGEGMATRTYEAMFVLDSAAKPFEAMAEEARQVLVKNGAEIVRAEKWTERRLAYPIAGRKRGTYYLTFFRASTSAVSAIMRESRLRETILRLLILERDGVETPRVPTPPEEGDRPGAFPRGEREAAPAQAL